MGLVTPRVDVHMLTLDEPAAWRDACIASLEGAPIQLHVLPGIPGKIGEARAAGFALGNLPLVSFVDPDDLYNAAAFEQLADILDSDPEVSVAYTDEVQIDVGGERCFTKHQGEYNRIKHTYSATHVHGLIMMRRAAVNEVVRKILNVTDWGEIWALTLLLAQRGEIQRLPIIGRYWRQHQGQVRRTYTTRG